jgi:hypothetical protein
MAKRKTVQVDDGEWVTISWTDQHEQCCNCDLEHRVDHRVVNGKLQFRASRVGGKS